MKTIGNIGFGDILLIEYRFSDASKNKLRPVVVLYTIQQDITVIKMTSQYSASKELLLLPKNNSNGLRVDTFLEYKKIDTFHQELFLQKIGSLSPQQKNHIKKILTNIIKSL